MSENGVYLTLPSKASLDFHPDNTLTHYTTALPQRISLSGQWECGLVEMQYSHSWYNVTSNNTWLGVTLGGATYAVRIDAGYYDTSTTLIRTINRRIRAVVKEKNVKLSYNHITQKVTIYMVQNNAFCVYSLDLQNVLGLTQSIYTSPENENENERGFTTVIEAESVIDLAQGFYALYVYTSIVESRVVGDSVVPLLSIVPIEGKHGEIVSKSFHNVQYVTVFHKEFTTIEVDIRDDTGRPVPFERGRTTVTFHFRRRKSALF